MRELDQHEHLVWNNTIDGGVCAAVMGKGEEFVLIRLDKTDPNEQETMERAIAQGFTYCGVLGFKDGQSAVRCEQQNPGAIYTMMFAGVAFAHVIAEALRRQQGDAVDWLERLHSLPDTRS